jgi:hypothetical protein
MRDDTRELLDRVTRESEEEYEREKDTPDDGLPLPAHVKVTRGHDRSRTLQMRLTADEYEALESLATSRGLPVSTVARSLLLPTLAPVTDAGAAITRIENELEALRRSVV